MDKRVVNLPKWAQKDMTYAYNKIRRLEEQLETIQRTATKSDMITYHPIQGGEDRALPDSRLAIKLNGEHEALRLYVAVDHKGRKYLQLQGTDSVYVRPAADNAVNVYCTRDYE